MRVLVRRGNAEDIPWMLGQLKEFSDFFESKLSLYSENHARDGLHRTMKTGLVLIAETDSSERLGLIVGAITPHLFNPEILVLTELLWWVDSAHRKTRAGYLLLKAFVAFGKDNVDWITFTLEEKSPVKEETLLRQGFIRKERNYLIEVGCEYGSDNNDSSDNGCGSSGRWDGVLGSRITESKEEGRKSGPPARTGAGTP